MPEKITKRLVDATKPGERDLFVWDTEVKGFGLKVTPAGGKVYVLQYRIDGGRATAPKRFTIGKHGSPWTADTARDEAIRLLGMVKAGIDPQSQKMATRAAASIKADTFAEVAALFVERYAKPNTRSWEATERIFLKHVNPTWGDRPLKDIARRDVSRLLNDLVDSGTPVLANRALSAIRKMFNWAVSNDHAETNPCAGLEPPAQEESRDRVLSDEELREVWTAAAGLGDLLGSFVRMLILTAQRRDEVAGMRWTELDISGKLWTIPKERAKNGKAHQVPLSDDAVAILEALPRVVTEDGSPSDFVFTTTGTSPISGFSRAKDKLDRLTLESRQKAAQERGQNPEQVKALEEWRFHDLRRTVTTGLARMGIPPQVADRILNHTQGTIKGVAAVYNRHAYLDERRAALDAWARKVDALVNGTPANVVRLQTVAA